jgi:hypothetical protein
VGSVLLQLVVVGEVEGRRLFISNQALYNSGTVQQTLTCVHMR